MLGLASRIWKFSHGNNISVSNYHPHDLRTRLTWQSPLDKVSLVRYEIHELNPHMSKVNGICTSYIVRKDKVISVLMANLPMVQTTYEINVWIFIFLREEEEEEEEDGDDGYGYGWSSNVPSLNPNASHYEDHSSKNNNHHSTTPWLIINNNTSITTTLNSSSNSSHTPFRFLIHPSLAIRATTWPPSQKMPLHTALFWSSLP